jgi:hypothetical protein
MPVLLSSLTGASEEELAGALAADESRCCLREWLALVPDPRSQLGGWHLLEFVLGLAVCAFTAAGHDSPEAVAEWTADCLSAAPRDDVRRSRRPRLSRVARKESHGTRTYVRSSRTSVLRARHPHSPDDKPVDHSYGQAH